MRAVRKKPLPGEGRGGLPWLLGYQIGWLPRGHRYRRITIGRATAAITATMAMMMATMARPLLAVAPAAPARPASPGAPSSPGAPTAPAGPPGPAGPTSPWGPMGPRAPSGPAAPAAPVAPAGPWADRLGSGRPGSSGRLREARQRRGVTGCVLAVRLNSVSSPPNSHAGWDWAVFTLSILKVIRPEERLTLDC